MRSDRSSMFMAVSLALLSLSLILFSWLIGCSREKPPPATDEQIARAVKMVLDIDKRLKSASIMVTCKEGVVTLTGFVRSKSDKKRAEKLAKKIQEVKRVVNKLVVLEEKR